MSDIENDQQKASEKRALLKEMVVSQVTLETIERLANIGSWSYDPVTQTPHWSEQMFHIWGLDPAKGPPSYLEHKEYIHPDDFQRFDEAVSAAVTSATPYNLELRIRRPDGTTISILSICEPQCDVSGKVIKLVGTNQNVTLLKEAAQSLREKELFLENLSDIAYMADDRGNVTYANPATERITGLKKEDFIGKPFQPLFVEEDHDSLRDIYLRTLAGESLENNLTFVSGVVCHFSSLPLKNSSGDIIGTFGIARDMTHTIQAEKALADSERKYYALVDQSPIAYEVYAADGIQLQVNKAYEDMWGMQAVDSVGLFNVRTDPQVEVLGLKPFVERAYAGEAIKLPEYEWDPGKSGFPGRARWLSTRIYPLKDEHDLVRNVVITHEDVTERRVAESSLRQRESELSAIIETTQDGFWLLDSEGNFSDVNDAYCSMSGYSREELLQMKISDVDANDDMDDVRTRIKRIIKQGSELFETSHRRKDGTLFNVEISTSWLDHKIGKFVCFGRDITERKQARAEVEASLALSQSIFNAIPDAIVSVDIERNIVATNNSFQEILGYSEQEILGRKTGYIYESEAEFKRLGRERYNMTAAEQAEPYLVNYRRKNGEIFPGETLGVPILNKRNERIGFLGIIRDITERLQMELSLRQAQKLEAVGTMVGGISHELNNVLQSMFLFGDLVQKELPESDSLRANFKYLLDGAEKARDIIKQILTFSRKTRIDMKPQPLQEIIRETLALVQASLPARITLEQQIDENCGYVACDRTQITQIVMNLCNNAHQALEDKGGTISVNLSQIKGSGKEQDSEPEQAELMVSDTGAGIDPSDFQRIFDPFYTTKEIGKGTGLGLSVIHGIVEMMGGHISVTSEANKLTTFRVLFPVMDLPESSQVDATLPTAANLVHRSILLVDDEEAIRNTTQSILIRKGFSVDCASNGQEALEFFQSDPEQYDLIITDLSMPLLSGTDLAQQIRRMNSNIPIILSTGHLSLADERRYEGFGITGFIQKPWTSDELIKQINALE